MKFTLWQAWDGQWGGTASDFRNIGHYDDLNTAQSALWEQMAEYRDAESWERPLRVYLRNEHTLDRVGFDFTTGDVYTELA